jgi:predicted nucleic acid-binding protein
MRVVDTSVWIEFLTASVLGRKLVKEIPVREACVVPTIVQMELAKWLSREVGDDASRQMLADTMECVVAPLDTATALSAAELSAVHKLSTADAIILATAKAYDAELLTCDAHFKDLPGVIYFAKVKQ